MYHLSEKDTISGFSVSSGSAEALTGGKKIKYHLIAIWPQQIWAKNWEMCPFGRGSWVPI